MDSIKGDEKSKKFISEIHPVTLKELKLVEDKKEKKQKNTTQVEVVSPS